MQHWVEMAMEAREIVREYYGDIGLVEVDQDMTPTKFSVPPDILPPVQATGAEQAAPQYVPALHTADRTALSAKRSAIESNLEYEQQQAKHAAVRNFDAQASAAAAAGPQAEEVLVPSTEDALGNPADWWYWFNPRTGATRWATPAELI